MFVASGLEEQEHVLSVTNIGKGPKGSFIDFDYVIFNSTIDPNAASSTSNSTGTNANSTSTSSGSTPSASSSTSSGNGSSPSGTFAKHSTNTGAIVGGVVGGLAALALIAFGAYWFFFRKRGDRSKQSEGRSFMEGVDPEPTSGSFGDRHSAYTTFTGPSLGGHTGNSVLGNHQDSVVTPYDPRYNQQQGYAQPGAGPPASPQMAQNRNLSPTFLSRVPPPPASNATSYPYSVQPPSSVAGGDVGEEVNPFTSGHSPALVSDPSSNERTPTGSAGSAPTQSPPVPALRTPAKAVGTALPYTAVRPRTDSSLSSELSSPRIQREQRETDMGPLPEELHSPGLLPPDYHQATQPLPGQSPTSDRNESGATQ